MVVLELQQAALTAAQRDNPLATAISVDSGPIRGRRVLEQMIAAEHAQPAAMLGAA
jgi:vanillate O-demethylase monooxygenase subunit